MILVEEFGVLEYIFILIVHLFSSILEHHNILCTKHNLLFIFTYFFVLNIFMFAHKYMICFYNHS